MKLPRIDGHRLSPKEGLDQHDKEEPGRGSAPRDHPPAIATVLFASSAAKNV